MCVCCVCVCVCEVCWCPSVQKSHFCEDQDCKWDIKMPIGTRRRSPWKWHPFWVLINFPIHLLQNDVDGFCHNQCSGRQTTAIYQHNKDDVACIYGRSVSAEHSVYTVWQRAMADKSFSQVKNRTGTKQRSDCVASQCSTNILINWMWYWRSIGMRTRRATLPWFVYLTPY